MKKMKIRFSLYFMTILIGSCSKDSETTTPTSSLEVDITSVVKAKFANSITGSIKFANTVRAMLLTTSIENLVSF